MKVKIKLHTLAFQFLDDYKVVVGFRFDKQLDDNLLVAAFEYDGQWRTKKYRLYDYEQHFNDPELDLVRLFHEFLEALLKTFEGKKIWLRKERNVWGVVTNLYYEFRPKKIEQPLDDWYGIIPKLKEIENQFL